MASPSLSITATQLAGKVRITPSVQNSNSLTSSTLSNVSVMVNDNTSSSPFTEINLPFLDEDNSTPTTPAYFSHYDLNSSQLSLGKGTFIQLKNTYIDGTVLYSAAVVSTLLNVPSTPVLTLSSNIRAEDQFYSVKINPTHTLNSVSDGYSKITKIVTYTSKVGGINPSTDFRRDEISVDIANNIADYTKWYPVATGLLTNDTQYEVSVKFVNAMGESQLSNTVLITPKNTPDQITFVDSQALLSFQRSKNLVTPGSFVEGDNRGDTVIRWKKPADFINLIQNSVGISKYYIYKQLMVKDQTNNYVASGQPSSIALTVPYTAPGATVGGVQASPMVNDPTYAQVDGVYDYRYIIEGSPAELGKAYQYSVVAENSNGLGPVSNSTSTTFVFASPSQQNFELLHSSTTSSLTGASITSYDGKMSIQVTSISSVNGAEDITESRTIAAATGLTVNGVSGLTAPAVTLTDYKMNLQITKFSTPLVNEFNGEVTLEQQYETIAGPTAGTAVYNPLNKWVLSFDNVNKAVGQTLNAYFAANFGTKFVFNLYRKSTDPSSLISYVFEAVKSTIQRTAFKSPGKVTSIEVYGFNDDLTPVTLSGQPALRLVFKQLTNAQMNGLANFTGTKKYIPHKDSYPIPNSDINHDPLQSGEIEYKVDMSQEGLGVNGNVYLRGQFYNDELNVLIDAAESSPVVVATARSYPSAVTGLNVINSGTTGGEITISWTKQSGQSINALGGFPTNEIQNRVVVIKDHATNSSPVYNNVVLWNAANQQVVVTGLTNGETYKVYVIAEGVYTRFGVDGIAKRFDGAIIANNLNKTSVIVAGTPSAPVIDGRFPSDKKFSVLHDAPLSLYGVPASSLEYQFFMNQENTSDFPYLSTNVLQQPVATTTNTTVTTLTKTFQTKTASGSIANLIDIVNDTPHVFAMLAKAVIGGSNLLKTTDPYNYPATIVNGSNFNKSLNLVSDLIVPSRTIYSDTTTKEIVYPGDSVPMPTGLELSGSEGKVTVAFIKVGGPVTDIDITVENNDTSILPFKTKDVVYSTFSGVFALEQAFADNALNNALPGSALYPYGPNGFNFRREVSGSVTRFYIDFVNLTNGVVLNFDVRNAKKVNNELIYSAPASGQAAAEAPPNPVQNASFSVDSGVINVSWSAPTNSGGAGVSGNTPLGYKIILLSSTGIVLATNTTTTNVLNTQFTGLTNWTQVNGVTYSVRVLAYYNKSTGQLIEGDYVTPFPANNYMQTTQLTNLQSPIQIKVNAAPVNATGTFLAGDNKITGSIITASSANQTLYPLSYYKIIYKSNSGTIVAETTSQTFNNMSPIIGSNVAQPNSAFTGGVTSTINEIASLANGKQYTVIIRAVPIYNWAQGPADVEYSVTPYGALSITAVSVVAATAGKTMKVDFDLNGSGSVNTVIGLGKSANNNSIVVKNLSSSLSNLPSITPSGLENSTRAANQLGTFNISFPELSTALNDLLVVVGNTHSVDTYVYPVSGSFFQ